MAGLTKLSGLGGSLCLWDPVEKEEIESLACPLALPCLSRPLRPTSHQHGTDLLPITVLTAVY